jgi:D-glycero-alpha-D-manno-heptose-7-phosphate kinase
MIITRSPLRICLAGGGTDLESFYKKYTSNFISAAINSYVYVTINKPFINQYILKYSRYESTKSIASIKHDLIREILKRFGKKDDYIEMSTTADVPYGTGLGSSGAFSSCLIKALSTYNRNKLNSEEIAESSFFIETKILKEIAGKQDPYISSYGGISKFIINKKGKVHSQRLDIPLRYLNKLNDNLLLFFTGFSRSSTKILINQENKTKKKNQQIIKNLKETLSEVSLIEKYLTNGNLTNYGELLREQWDRKKKRSKHMTNIYIEDIYNFALKNGAVGGKLVGAGGGGFLLFYSDNPENLRHAMNQKNITELRFIFDFEGTKNLFVKF